MIAGHFGLAAMVKAREQRTPLWMLMLATVWLDVLFVPLYVFGVETIRPVHGTLGYGQGVIFADYTHSVVGMLVLFVLLAAPCYKAWGRRSALVIGLVSISHWALDLLVHRADMAVLPANYLHLPRLGLGLWRTPAVAAALELALVAAGSWLYWRAAREVCLRDGRGTRLATTAALMIGAFGALVLLLDFTG